MKPTMLLCLLVPILAAGSFRLSLAPACIIAEQHDDIWAQSIDTLNDAAHAGGVNVRAADMCVADCGDGQRRTAPVFAHNGDAANDERVRLDQPCVDIEAVKHGEQPEQ